MSTVQQGQGYGSGLEPAVHSDTGGLGRSESGGRVGAGLQCSSGMSSAGGAPITRTLHPAPANVAVAVRGVIETLGRESVRRSRRVLGTWVTADQA